MAASAASRSCPASACRCAASARPHCRRLESRPRGSAEPCRTGTSARPAVQATCGDAPPRGHPVTPGCGWVSPRQGCGLPTAGARDAWGRVPAPGARGRGGGDAHSHPGPTRPKGRGYRKGGGASDPTRGCGPRWCRPPDHTWQSWGRSPQDRQTTVQMRRAMGSRGAALPGGRGTGQGQRHPTRSPQLTLRYPREGPRAVPPSATLAPGPGDGRGRRWPSPHP